MSSRNEEFAGTARFEVKGRLGAGGMGVVYEAYDREKNVPVALKTLHNAAPRTRARLEREFHALHELSHPNLVKLGELVLDDEVCFFTMELVEGSDFLLHVRPKGTAPAGKTYEEAKLRSALRQLAEAIATLHRAGKLHRDIKPSNILVTDDGRVVLVDFGLAGRANPAVQTTPHGIKGTVEYMAPEQALGEDVGPAADWYAMGVVLYEALTGHLPHSGKTAFDLLRKKQQRTPPPPRQRVPEVPPDLDELCVELLRTDPERRPSGDEILARLGVGKITDSNKMPAARPASLIQTTPFIGREKELAALREAYDESRKGAPATVLVQGESGLGKTELARVFLDALNATADRVLVLAGRSYEREAVPYDAFDGVAEALTRHLKALSPPDIAALLPARAEFLSLLFPMFQQVDAIAKAPIDARFALDPQERRTRMFRAFRELLVRVAARQPVILVIDDLQWAGADSLTMLAEVMHPAEAPPLMLLGLARPGVEERLARALPAETRQLFLSELTQTEARELVALLAPRLSAEQLQTIAEESSGHPLFIHELARQVDAGGIGDSMRLDDVLWARIAALSPEPRTLLDLLAVADAPIAQDTLAAAAEIGHRRCATALEVLRRLLLARTGSRDPNTVAPYHDRIREAVLAHLDPATRTKHHHELAIALESAGAAATDPHALVRHFAAAGLSGRAAKHAEDAAARASAMSAFDQAAELYKTAIDLGQHSAESERELRLLHGQVLVGAGRGLEAADAFLIAAEGADPATRRECRRLAAEQLLLSGHLERGLEAMHSLLAEIDLQLPKTPRRALASLFWQRAKLRLRGLGWKERQESEITPEFLIRHDICKAVGQGLSLIDSVRAADFNARALLLALRTGERARVARALFQEVTFLSNSGKPRSLVRARDLVAEGSRIAEPIHGPYLEAWRLAGESGICYFEGRFRLASESYTKAELALREVAGTGWEISTVRLFGMWALHRIGAVAEMEPRLSEYLRDAERRGDRYAFTTLIRSCHRVPLALRGVEETRAQLSLADWIPPEGRYHLQHWYEFDARAEIALHEGSALTVLEEANKAGHGLARSMLMRIQTVRVDYRWLRARLLLAAAEGRSVASAALREASQLARKLEGEPVTYAHVMASLVNAALAAHADESERACSLLENAIDAANREDMYLHAAVAERRLGEILGGDDGAAHLARAEDWMSNEGIVNPARITEVFAPGFARSGAAAARGTAMGTVERGARGR